MSAQLLDITPAAYHADPAPEPSLSASIANVLLKRSPLHAWQAHPRLGGGDGADATPAQDRGSLIHKLVLGKGAEVEIIEAKDFKTKAAQQARDEARARGHIPALERVYEDAVEAATTILVRLADHGVQLTGQSEAAVLWQAESKHGPVWCRSMFDHVLIDRGTIYDLKSTRDARAEACGRHAVDYGYDVQRAAYVRALETLRPELAGRVELVFLFVELEPPYAVTVGPLDGVLRERGERRWCRAVETWATCMRTGEWNADGYGRAYIEAPPWLAARMGGEL